MAHSRGNPMAPATEALTLGEAAGMLGVTERQISHAIAQGAPVVRRGGRGRGRATLVDPQSISEWFATRGEFSLVYRKRLADGVTAAMAAATVAQFRAASGPHKLQLGIGQLHQFLETDRAMREQLGLPALEPDQLPADIQQIAKSVSIFR